MIYYISLIYTMPIGVTGTELFMFESKWQLQTWEQQRLAKSIFKATSPQKGVALRITISNKPSRKSTSVYRRFENDYLAKIRQNYKLG